MRRYALRDDQWERIKDLLPGREGHVGVCRATWKIDPLTTRGIAPSRQGQNGGFMRRLSSGALRFKDPRREAMLEPDEVSAMQFRPDLILAVALV